MEKLVSNLSPCFQLLLLSASSLKAIRISSQTNSTVIKVHPLLKRIIASSMKILEFSVFNFISGLGKREVWEAR